MNRFSLLHTFFILFTLQLLLGCQEIEYKSDLELLSSGIANSPEVLAFIDGSECKDSKGAIGGCYVRHKKGSDVLFSLLPTDYAYRLEFKCSSDSNIAFNVDVLPEQKYEWKIEKEKITNLDTTICRGRIFPQRDAVVSSFFEVRIIFVDSKYIDRENIITYENKLILGENAFKTIVFEGDKVNRYEKKTVIDEPEKYCVISESEGQRFNYLCKGMTWQQIK